MKRIFLIISLLLPLVSYGQFDRWFEDKTMRFDYYHAGDAQTEEYYFAEVRQEPYWAGSKTSLLDDRGYGEQFFRIIDKATGETIYTRGFSTLWNEWQTTEEASHIHKAMPESVVFPFPKSEVRIEIYSRGNDGLMMKKFEQAIDPSSIFVAKYPLRYDTFEVEVNGGTEHKVDIVLLPEGYDATERAAFEEACRFFASEMFSFEPYKGLRHMFNIRAVWAPSADSGVTIPGNGVWKDTATKATFWTFGTERYQTTEYMHDVRTLAGHVPYEYVYILSNTEKYGGGGIYNFYGISAANHPLSTGKVYIHEFGHLFAGLGDEYVGDVAYGDMYPVDVEPWEPNLTTLADFGLKKWLYMLPEGTLIPTPLAPDSAEELGVYEGGGYSAKGVYRPWPNCLMNNLHTISKFCPVCDRAIRDQIEFICK